MILKILILALVYFEGAYTSNAKTEENNGPKIVGGQNSPLGSIPHQVSLQRTGTTNYHICGGTLVSLSHVVTAAHCFFDPNGNLLTNPSSYQVNAGQVDLYSPSWQTRRPSNITMHPSFNPRTLQADIAVIKLSTAFSQTTALAPINITYQEFAQRTMCQISGWGLVNENAKVERYLQAAMVPIVNQTICRQVYDMVLNDMVCAGYDVGGVDACQGDSGGPLTCNNTLTGVVSWGYGCARYGYYGVYTRIETYSTWIDRIVNGSSSMKGTLFYSVVLSIILYFLTMFE